MDYRALVGVYHALEETTKRLEKTEIIAIFLKKVPDDEIRDMICFRKVVFSTVG